MCVAGGSSFLESHLASLSYLVYDQTISLLQVDTGMCPIGSPRRCVQGYSLLCSGGVGYLGDNC